MNGVNHCGAYLEHLQAEHQRLNCAFLEIRSELAGVPEDTQPQERSDALIDRLESLLRELRSHFAEEEDGECLEEAVARCPSVWPNVKVLMRDHPQLVKALEQLIVGMKSRTIDGKTCREMFEAFATDLKAHECAESRLLQLALGGDASDYDVEGNE